MSRATRGAASGLLAALGAAALVAGCLDANVPSAVPTPTHAPDPTPVTTVYDLRANAWYEGLALHVDRVTATLDERGGPVVIVVRMDNDTADASRLDGVVSLVVAGRRFEPTRDSNIPEVPDHGSAAATFRYELQGVASIDRAVIEIGAGPLHVARIPLTPTAGALDALEPLALKPIGNATANGLRISLRSGVLRWDLPDWSQELASSEAALTITYDVTFAGDFSGGLAFTGENVALRLPDGTIVDPRPDGHSQSVELIGPRKTKKGLFSRFEIPAGLTGEFVLLVRNGSAEKVIVFTVG